MFTWRNCLKLLRELEPHEQVKSLLISTVLLMMMSTGLALLWESSSSSDEATWTRVPARLTSRGKTWDSDKNLYGFSIRLKTPDGRSHNAYLYAEKLYYHAAKLDLNTQILVDIETTNDTLTVRRALSENGIFVYDPLLKEHVTNKSNQETTRAVFFFFSLGASCLIAAAVIRHRAKNQ